MKKVSVEDEFYLFDFRIINDEIVVYYLNGETDVLPYSVENKITLLKELKEEIIDINETFEAKKKYFKKNIDLDIKWALSSLIISLGSLLFSFPTTIMIFSFSFSLMATTVTMSDILNLKRLDNNYKKYILFLQNSSGLNELIRKRPELTNNLDRNLKKKILPNNEKEITFTLDSINNMSYQDLQKIYENVEAITCKKNKKLSKKLIKR